MSAFPLPQARPHKTHLGQGAETPPGVRKEALNTSQLLRVLLRVCKCENLPSCIHKAITKTEADPLRGKVFNASRGGKNLAFSSFQLLTEINLSEFPAVRDDKASGKRLPRGGTCEDSGAVLALRHWGRTLNNTLKTHDYMLHVRLDSTLVWKRG